MRSCYSAADKRLGRKHDSIQEQYRSNITLPNLVVPRAADYHTGCPHSTKGAEKLVFRKVTVKNIKKPRSLRNLLSRTRPSWTSYMKLGTAGPIKLL